MVISSSTNDPDIISFILGHSGSTGQYDNAPVINIHNQDRYGSSTTKAMLASERSSFYPDFASCLTVKDNVGHSLGLHLHLLRTNEQRVTGFTPANRKICQTRFGISFEALLGLPVFAKRSQTWTGLLDAERINRKRKTYSRVVQFTNPTECPHNLGEW